MNLTTLARAKSYLAGVAVGSATGLDAIYNQLINAASGAACQFCGRTFQRMTYSGLLLSGNGNAKMYAPTNPIISVSSLSIDGAVQVASPAPAANQANTVGYQFDSKRFYMIGGVFREGLRNIQVSFVTAYNTQEAGVIPAAPFKLYPMVGLGVDAQGQPMNTSGYPVTDQGVTFTGGAALTPITTGTPTTGQYLFNAADTTPSYLFAAADTGRSVTMNYDFIPGDVEAAVLDTIGTWLKQKDNLGIASKSLANETISYRDVGLSKSAQMILQPYRWVLKP